jgi:hypothetical protein
LHERAALGIQHIGDDDLRAGLREQPRLGRPLPAAAACDEHSLILEILLHDACSLVLLRNETNRTTCMTCIHGAQPLRNFVLEMVTMHRFAPFDDAFKAAF